MNKKEAEDLVKEICDECVANGGKIIPPILEKRNANGELHCEDGPALIHEDKNGLTKCWYVDGKLHRRDGPALEFSDGYKEWYLNNHLINVRNQEEFLKLLNN